MSHLSERGPLSPAPGAAPTPERAPAASRHPLAAALLAVLIGALDLTVIATILPPMIYDLNVNTADIDRYIWVVNGYLLAYIVAIPIVGRISDLVGRRIAFDVALGIFVAGSLVCALANGLTALIIGRAIQGLGGGALLPVTMALVGDLLPPSRRTAALGLVGAVDTLGWVLGPLWGAAIVGVFGTHHQPWRIVFWINIPLGLIAAVAIAVTCRHLPRRGPRLSLRRLDVVGTVLLAIATVLLNLGLASGGELGGTAPGTGMRALGGTPNPLSKYLLPLLVGAVIFGVAFVLWEHRASLPVLPLSLFRIRPFSAAIAANFVVGAALIVAMVDVPLVVALLVSESHVSGISAFMLAPFTVLMAALSLVGGIIAGRVTQRATAALGLALVSIGYVALWAGLQGHHYMGMIPGLLVSGAGFGLVIAPIGATVINAVPARDRGIAAGLTIVFRLLGMTVGISALTAFGVRRLQTITRRLPPIVQKPGEATGDFILRQQQFIEQHAIPASVTVIRETFLLAAVLGIIALIPVLLMRQRRPPPPQPPSPEETAPATAAAPGLRSASGPANAKARPPAGQRSHQPPASSR